MANEAFASISGTIDCDPDKFEISTSDTSEWPYILRLGGVSVFLSQDALDKLKEVLAEQELTAA